ncbi:hypothetical protein ACH5RR_035754 [Cinchona calisaya]|uniref:GST C-terminal domain-containing protein n=1 Tax=Cinchona calisaya TaxID=153742 RepID=A0ABD2Y3D6_9GENT
MHMHAWLPLMVQLIDYATGEEEAKKALKDKIIEKMLILEGAFVNCSKGKAFFSGDDIGYLDIALRSHLGWLKGMERLENVKLLDETKMPNLMEWAHKFSSNEIVKDVTLELDGMGA